MNFSRKILRKLQQKELEILIDFDKYCRENGFQYYLIGGALLGAVRYGGFIPWDDDIDVALPREDYDRLKKEYRSEKYFLQNSESDPGFARCIQKIRMNGTKIVEFATENIDIHQGIYIDIFPIDYVEKNAPEILDKRGRTIRKLMSLRAIKSGYRSDKHRFLKWIIKNCCPLSINEIEKRLYDLCTLENKHTKNYAIIWLHNYPWDRQIHPMETFGEGLPCLFEGKTFIGPVKTDSFLRKVFGDNYMEEPLKEKQQMPHKYLKVEF